MRRLRKEGKSFEEAVGALRSSDDPDIAAWARDKADADGGRQYQRAWANAEKYLSCPEIAELNDEYAVVLVGNGAAILRESMDIDHKPVWSLLQTTAFHTWLANRQVNIGTGSNPKMMPLSKHWMAHPLRRQYQGIVFSPGREDEGGNYFNLWKGFAVEPREGDCSLFLDHIFVNVCRRNEELYRWVLAWFADIVQRPNRKLGTSLVLRGQQGTGKSITGKAIGSLLGDHYVSVSDPRYITGRFNSHLVSCLLLHADEGFWAGDHAAEGKLKDLVTGESHLVELKGKEPIRVRNYVRLLVTGNPNWLVPAAMEERRFAVLDMGIEHKEDHAYFAAIEQQLDNGGREALLYFLLNYDTTGVNLRTIPRTDALLDQKMVSMSPEHAWWCDVLMNGRLPAHGDGSGRYSKKDLFNAYINHANKVGVKRCSIETQLGRFLYKVVPALRTHQNCLFTNDEGADVKGDGYSFPSLKTCRGYFVDQIAQDIQWPESDDW